MNLLALLASLKYEPESTVENLAVGFAFPTPSLDAEGLDELDAEIEALFNANEQLAENTDPV